MFDLHSVKFTLLKYTVGLFTDVHNGVNGVTLTTFPILSPYMLLCGLVFSLSVTFDNQWPVSSLSCFSFFIVLSTTQILYIVIFRVCFISPSIQLLRFVCVVACVNAGSIFIVQ